jgi:integrase
MAGLLKRGKVYYAVYRVGTKERRRSLETTSYQVAREKLRKLESSLAQGEEQCLPTKTPIPDIVAAYIDHMRAVKTKNGLKVDLWYLFDTFGPVCPDLEGRQTRRHPPRGNQKKQARRFFLEVGHLEDLTTATVSEFISRKVQTKGISPKTANRYREILMRLVSWAMDQRGVRMPGDRNPVKKVERYKERASNIRFLTLRQVDEQLDVLADSTQLQTMVAMYIYAGLRREELLWLTLEDLDLRAAKYGLIRVRAKSVQEEYWEPKTKVNRAVPISRALRGYIDRYQQRIVPGHWCFPSPEGKRWDPDNFSQALRKANKKAGLAWSCLDFRHTFGSQLAMKGESLYKISKLLGNSPEICRRHYAALAPEDLWDAVEFDAVETSHNNAAGLRLIRGKKTARR